MAEPVRRTPYELVVVEGGHEAALQSIADEAESRGLDPAEPDRFFLLETAGTLLRALRPESESADAIARYGALLFHTFHFRAEGQPLFVVDAPTVRALLAPPRPVGAWRLRAPARAGYMQLPRNLIWAPGGEGSAAEPVDGFFWTSSADPVAGRDRLLLALVIGMRPGRAGFGLIEAAAELPPPPAAHWADVQARENGEDFANILPGGEIQGLFALTSFGEAFRLASLVFHTAMESGRMGAEERERADAPTPPHGMPPTALPFRRIALGGDG